MKYYIGDGMIAAELTPSLPHLVLLNTSPHGPAPRLLRDITGPVDQMDWLLNSPVCMIVIHGFSSQVAEEEFKIEARLQYKDFDAWSPWVSSDSPVRKISSAFLLLLHPLILFRGKRRWEVRWTSCW